MKNLKMKNTLKLMVVLLSLHGSAYAALKLDRTRAIFPGDQKRISLVAENENTENPYLAQNWLETSTGVELKNYFTVVPPLTRVNPSEKLNVRIEKLSDADTLPQDRESLFYYILREIPPKADGNILQLSLQTKIKLFYRPASIIKKKNNTEFYKDVSFLKTSGKFIVSNKTPYYVVLLAIKDKSTGVLFSNTKPSTIPPFSQVQINESNSNKHVISAVFIDDWGGRPVIDYDCSNNNHCVYKGLQN